MEKYTETIQIQSFQTNHFAEATVPSIFNFMLEAAWAHAQTLDWGYDLLQKNNMFWVLSRMYVEINKLPKWQDKIKLNTWSAGTDGMYAYREFILENEAGEVILTGNTAWLILDTESKKIVMLRNHKETFPRFSEQGVCREPKRLRFKKSEESLSFEPIVFSDIDVNHHFNSVKALERVLDEYGIDFQNAYEPATIEVNYLKEGLPGDALAVTKNTISNSRFQSAIVRESDAAELSTFEIDWRRK
ncbi:acyl-[acyl-carrier-protein] thioesterase [Mangrovibacterium lignilyticum]|uniref:acyl-[acyl-carrier-protein] thioesterase n=1 Tax=Mangrovibacterium lignilyticum TaxID=2668052 RepID=UPI0013D5C2A8|nr:acyl-ACP thioesterase domain-containing protein [Mangrovibacterium lignilyticum]